MLWLYNLLKRSKCNYKLKPESSTQIEFADRLRLLSLEGKLGCVWYAISNEIGAVDNNPRYGAYLQALGKISGSPDMAFHWKGGSGFIEFKSEKGRQSETQKLFEKWCDFHGIDYKIARSASEGMQILKKWNLINE